MQRPPLTPLWDSKLGGQGRGQTNVGCWLRIVWLLPKEAELREFYLDRVVSGWEDVRVEGKT